MLVGSLRSDTTAVQIISVVLSVIFFHIAFIFAQSNQGAWKLIKYVQAASVIWLLASEAPVISLITTVFNSRVVHVLAVIVAGYKLFAFWSSTIIISLVPPQAASWNVGATHTQLEVKICAAVHTATVSATQAALHVISSQSVPFANHVTGKPVILVITQAVGIHSAGVTRVGEVAKTKAPEPVSSDITHLSCKEVVAANWDSGSAVSASQAHVAGVLKLPSPSKYSVAVPESFFKKPCLEVVALLVVMSVVVIVASDIVWFQVLVQLVFHTTIFSASVT